LLRAAHLLLRAPHFLLGAPHSKYRDFIVCIVTCVNYKY
jgi:hypothetical protein